MSLRDELQFTLDKSIIYTKLRMAYILLEKTTIYHDKLLSFKKQKVCHIRFYKSSDFGKIMLK
ncbi:hypothetical protein [Moraxella lacunata]|uniref:hypothetical protein n=1 Tax=Moraxella lacunata TaxID=477 RepID=UPI003EE00C60